MQRAIILKYVFVKGQMVPPPDVLSALKKGKSDEENRALEFEWNKQFDEMGQRLRENRLWEQMGSREQEFIQANPTGVTQQEIIDASWVVESIASLFWALGLLVEIPPWDRQVDPQVTNRLPQLPIRELLRSATLRTRAEIDKARDVAELWHWRARTRQLQEAGRMPALVGGKFTIEEVLKITAAKASEAGDIPRPIHDDFPACGMAPSNRWEETPTDT